MSAGVFILILVVAIAALVLMIVKAKMHPVLALFIAALGTGIALGYGVTGSVDYISNGFGGHAGQRGHHHHPWRHHFHGHRGYWRRQGHCKLLYQAVPW